MTDIAISKDALSHGQIKSKQWLADQFYTWSASHLNIKAQHTLHWFGSWVGFGPFLFLVKNSAIINCVHLYELSLQHLDISVNVLDRWLCEGLHIVKHHSDVNMATYETVDNSIFINTACEHMNDLTWLKNIPKNSHVLLQSTNMNHIEHTNKTTSLQHFVLQNEANLHILETAQLDFDYVENGFSRYMIFGIKK